MLEIKIIKKETDLICTRVSMGGNQILGYYVVYRGELNDVLTVLDTCAAAVRAELTKSKVMTCKCGSQANNQVLTPGEQHYGKVVCASCGKWLAWLPRPARPIDKAKLPKPLALGAELPKLTGKSPAQIAFGERCREKMIHEQSCSSLSAEMFEAMKTITDCTFWIANANKAPNLLRWPEEWS